MTLEERAREVLKAVAGAPYLLFEDDPRADRQADRISAPKVIAAMLAFAAEERERAAKVAYATCAETRHVTLGDKCSAAIRNMEQGQ